MPVRCEGPSRVSLDEGLTVRRLRCPKCKAEKKSFVPVTMTIAGFVDNSKYGLGGNNLTSEQKSGLIFGSLLFFFFLFLSGYLLE